MTPTLDLSNDSHTEIITPSHIFNERDTVYAFTDGACSKGGKGGWSCILQWQDKMMVKFGCGHSPEITSNRMELSGILAAFRSIKKGMVLPFVVYTDSQYCQKAISFWTAGWKRAGWVTAQGTKVKNQDLIEEIYDRYLHSKKMRKTRLEWLKGHQDDSTRAEHQYNCLADNLATQAKMKQVANTRLG